MANRSQNRKDPAIVDDARGLLAAAQESGSLHSEEIALAFDELDVEGAQLDEFYSVLDELQIVVLDGDADEEVEPEVEETAREVSTDALQLFLKDIGRVDLLTAAQE